MDIKHRSQIGEFLKARDALGVSAEIGCAEGYYSAEILSWGVKQHYMVDAWSSHPELKGDIGSPQSWHDNNYADCLARVAPFKDHVVILRGMSVEMSKQVPDESLDFVYLDAGHLYEPVMADLVAWLPKLKPGRILAGHDYLMQQYGVFKAVNEFTEKHGFEVNLIPEHKIEDAGFWFAKTH